MLTIFASITDFNFWEMGTKQARDVLRASLAVARFFKKKTSRTRALLYFLSRQTKFSDSSQRGLVVENCLYFTTARRFCQVGTHNPISFWDPNVILQGINRKTIFSSKESKFFSFVLVNNAHCLSFAEYLEGMDASCKGCYPCPTCKIGFSVYFVWIGDETIPRFKQAILRIHIS